MIDCDLLDDDRENSRRRNRENRAEDPPQRAANEQRGHDRDRADADALFHDLRHEHIRFELVEDQEVRADGERELRRYGQSDRDGGHAADHRSDDRNRLAERRHQRDHVEVRDRHQPESGGRERAHHAREHQLRAQPRADTQDRRPPRGRHVRAPSGRDESDDVLEHRLRFDEQVEAQDDDRDHPERAADDGADGDEHGADGIARRAARRVLHRLLERDEAAGRHQSFVDEERLQSIELVGKPSPQRLSLRDERRHDGERDQHDGRQNRDVDHEDRQPPRNAPPAVVGTRALDETHQR